MGTVLLKQQSVFMLDRHPLQLILNMTKDGLENRGRTWQAKLALKYIKQMYGNVCEIKVLFRQSDVIAFPEVTAGYMNVALSY